MEFHSDSGTYDIDYTDVTEVTVLRLKFKTDGVVYNLGVVANSYNPDQTPDGEYDTGDGIKENFNEFLKKLEEMFNDFAGFMKGIVGGFVAILAIGALVFVVWIFVSVLRLKSLKSKIKKCPFGHSYFNISSSVSQISLHCLHT